MKKYVTKNKHHFNRARSVTLCAVTKSQWSRYLVLFLCVSLLISPIERALADTDESVDLVNTSELLDPLDLSPIPSDPDESNLVIEGAGEKEVGVNSMQDDLNSSTDTEFDVGNASASSTMDYSSRDSDLTSQSQSKSEQIGVDDLTVRDTLYEVASTSSTGTISVHVEENTSKSLIEGDTNELMVQTSSDMQVVFDRNSCVLVADGSYYCRSDNSDVVPERPDGVYAFPDKDGDLEIFIQRDSKLNQITSNLLEDSSPFYDSISNTIVWHRQIDDRYQIISYDVSIQKETQLTTGETNNMEPTKQGVYTAWQTWIDNNWEIILFDGEEMRRITDNKEHDVGPQIRNGLLVWSRGSGNRQTAEVYNLTTGEYISIKDIDGGIISNPRMVLLYESKNSTGDVEIKGYDMVTGQILPIGSTPARVPVRIPHPDDTSEPRALIQTKLQKQDFSVVDDNGIDSDNNPDDDSLTEDSVITNYDFDAQDTLILFDYGQESDLNDTEEEIMAEESFVLDLRPEPNTGAELNADLTLVIPSWSELSNDDKNEELTMLIESESAR